MTAPIIPGAEPWSAEGGPHGALCVHGFTGNPNSMRGLAEAFHAAGFAVELPLLPGHGTSIEDLIPTGWSDWYGEASAAYDRLAARCDKVVVVGLSMGGALTLALAADHPEIAGIVCINAVTRAPEGMEEGIQALVDAGETVIPGVGSDIADPDVTESAYPEMALAPLVTLFAAADELSSRIADVTCPVLVMTSPQDHVVDPGDSDHLAATVQGPVERIMLDRSFHVATMDYDKDLVEKSAVAFAQKVCQ